LRMSCRIVRQLESLISLGIRLEMKESRLLQVHSKTNKSSNFILLVWQRITSVIMGAISFVS